MPFSYLSHLDCPRCQQRYEADQLNGLCTCGSPLLARYDLGAAAALDRGYLTARAPSLWCYHELLPVRDPRHVVTMGEGMTPLVPLSRFGAAAGVPRLLMKDEGLIPTGTFKARGAAVGVSRAAELGVRGVAMPTNGNAGAAWSAYAARAGLRSLIAMPLDAPLITRNECVAAGADLHPSAGRPARVRPAGRGVPVPGGRGLPDRRALPAGLGLAGWHRGGADPQHRPGPEVSRHGGGAGARSGPRRLHPGPHWAWGISRPRGKGTAGATD